MEGASDPQATPQGAHARDDSQVITNSKVRLVIVLSGKRKSGKDYISSLLMEQIGAQRMGQVAILRIAGPIKSEFARNNNLDFTRLLDSSAYKEHFRQAMVDWSESYRKRVGWNCFLEQAIEELSAHDKVIWILNDARRACDIEYFEESPVFVNTKVLKLRIEASERVRRDRGWEFVSGIDDRATECGLDSYERWTHVIGNDSHDESLAENLKPVYEAIEEAFEGDS